MRNVLLLFVHVFFFDTLVLAQASDLQAHLSPGSTGLSSSTIYNAGNCHIAYPSPLNPTEMSSPAGCSTSVNYRDLDTGYMIIIGGNFTVPSTGGTEIEGRMAVGGDFVMHKTTSFGVSESGGGSFVLGDTGNWALNVHGDLYVTSSSGSVHVGTNGRATGQYKIRIGGSAYLNGSLSADVVDSVSSTDVNITSLLATVSSLSDSMSNATPTVNLTQLTPGWGPTLKGTESDIEIFNLEGSQLNQVGYSTNITFTDSIKSGATIILNVSGTVIDVGYVLGVGRMNDPYNDSTADDDAVVYNVLWNFYEADTINLLRDLNGTIFAPEAEYIEVNGNLNGRVYANGDLYFAGTGREIHNFPFNGNISAFAATAPPLPVNWISFTASATNPGEVQLNWSTASELNTDRFEVERGFDGKVFAPIGTIKASGNSSEIRQYTYTDRRVDSETVYYRLRQFDLDGTSTYSEVRRVRFYQTPDFSVYPNPADDQICIRMTSQDQDEAEINVIRMDGKTVLSMTTTDQLTELDLSQLDNGIYFLQVTGSDLHHTTLVQVLR